MRFGTKLSDSYIKAHEFMKDAKIREIARLRRNSYARLTKPVAATRAKPTHCECCGSIADRKPLGRDHDHITTLFRGWLCVNCNLGLGNFKDDPRILRRAADYITAHRIWTTEPIQTQLGDLNMTKKDFELIAATLKATRDSYAPHWNPNLFRACNDHAKQMADALATTNPRFDRARFLAACGVEAQS